MVLWETSFEFAFLSNSYRATDNDKGQFRSVYALQV